jgi:heme exporter protein D
VTVPAAVWLIVGLASSVILGIVAVALVRQGLLLGRATMRLAREASEATAGMGSVGERRTHRR